MGTRSGAEHDDEAQLAHLLRCLRLPEGRCEARADGVTVSLCETQSFFGKGPGGRQDAFSQALKFVMDQLRIANEQYPVALTAVPTAEGMESSHEGEDTHACIVLVPEKCDTPEVEFRLRLSCTLELLRTPSVACVSDCGSFVR